MGRGRYGDTNDGQDTGSEPSSQPESSSSETIETQQTSEEPTPTTSPTTQTSENISDVIMENTDPDRGFLTSSGTYVNIYKNAGNNERTYTSDNTVKPAGERIDPRSNEGQIIQQQYADQADRRTDNLAQSERFWAIREGQGSVKDLLYDSQSAEQRRLTDIFFEERNLDINTPLNQLSLSPKRYATAREQLTTGENIPKDGVKVPDSIWLKTDTPTQSELKTFEEYRAEIVKDATTVKPASEKITAISEGATFSDMSYNTYDLNTKSWKPTPIDDGQKQSAKELVDDARAQGFNFVTITKQRVGVPDSTITISISGTDAYSKIENEFRKANVYGQANDQVSIIGHIDKNILPLPEDEKKTQIPMMDGIPYLLGGSLLFAQLIKNKDNIPVGDTSGEINQSYESWLAGEAPSTFSQVFTEDVAGTKISDYRQRPELGYLAVPQQLGAIVQGGVTGKLDETEFMDTALDSGIRVLMAFGDPSKGTSSQTKEGSRTSVGGTYSGGGGLEGMIKQIEIESKLWDAYGGYYWNTLQTEIGLIAVTGGATTVARLSGRAGVGVVAQALKISPALSTANQLKLAKVARQLTRGAIAVPMNLVFGGLGKASGKITLESVQKMTEVEAEAYGYGTLRKIVAEDPLLKNFDVTPENKIADNIAENRKLEEDQTRLNQIDDQNYAEMGRASQEGGVYDAGYSSQLVGARADGSNVLSIPESKTVVMPQEGFPRLVDNPLSDEVKNIGLPVYYRDPVSTQSPLMREVNFGRIVSDEEMKMIDTYNFEYLRTQPLTTRGNPVVIPELSSPALKLVPDELPSSTFGMYEDMVNTPLGFIDAQGTRVSGRIRTDPVLPQSDIKIGDDFIDYKPLEKLPQATIDEVKIQNNMIRFRLSRGTEEYFSTSYIDPKNKKIKSTTLTGVNWSSFNPDKKIFINPSPDTIKNLMLVPERQEDKLPRFGSFTDSESGVWKIAGNEQEKLDALMIRYMMDEKQFTPTSVIDETTGKKITVEEPSSDVKNIIRYKDERLEIDFLKDLIKNKKSKRFKYLNNLFAPKKSKTDNVMTWVSRERKAKRIKEYETGLKDDETRLELLQKNLGLSQSRAETSALKLWESDVTKMYVDQQTLQAREGVKDLTSDPYFYNLPKSITSEERTQIAKITADARYRQLAQDDFYNIGRVLGAEEIDAINTISRLNLMVDQGVESTVASQRQSTAFGRSVTEYVQDKRVVDQLNQFTPTSTTITDDFALVTFGDVLDGFASGKVTNEADRNLRKSLLNIQGNEVSYQLSTTGISAPIRESRNMRGRFTEWTNPSGDISEAMEQNIRAKQFKETEKKELQKELSVVEQRLADIKTNMDIQKQFQLNPNAFIVTRQEPVTPEVLENYIKIRFEAEAKLAQFPDGRPTVEKLDSSQGKPTSTKTNNKISDISNVKTSTIEDVTGGYSDPDRGFQSDIKSIDDLIRLQDEARITNPEETTDISKLLWNQEMPKPREVGTGKDGIVDTGKKADDYNNSLFEQMKRIEEQKIQQWKYDVAFKAQKESDEWLTAKFTELAFAQKALDEYVPQPKVDSARIFVSERVDNTPINQQQSIWNNRIDTPEGEYLKLLVQKESLDQQSSIVDYQLGQMNVKIGNIGGKDSAGNWQKASGMYSDIDPKKWQSSASNTLYKILESEEQSMLRQAVSGDFTKAPVQSNKQKVHFNPTQRERLSELVDRGSVTADWLKKNTVSTKYDSDPTFKEAQTELLRLFTDIKDKRKAELLKETRLAEFSEGSFTSPFAQFDEVSMNVQRPRQFTSPNLNMQQGTVVPQFMREQANIPSDAPKVLGEGQVRVYEYVNPSKMDEQFETREVFYTQPTFDKTSLNVQKPELVKEPEFRIVDEQFNWTVDQKTYISNLNKISEQKIVRDSLQTRSFELKTQADEVAKSITSTPSDIKIRVGNLEQVAPDKRKLTELSLLRDTTENTQRKIKRDLKNNLEDQQMLQVEEYKIKDIKPNPIQSMTPLGGQFSINTKNLSDMQARQLSYVLPKVGEDEGFRKIENIFDSNERYDGTVYFENVYRDRTGTDLRQLKEPENMKPEELQAWNKVKDLEMKYDQALGIRYKMGGGTDNVPAQTDTVLKEIESMLSTPRKYIGKKDNPNLGSQANYGETSDIYNIQTRQLDEAMYKPNTEGTPNPLDKTDPKLVSKYEKKFLQQLKSKYQSHEKLTVKTDKLNEQRNELVAQLSRLEDGKSSPTYTANIYNTKTVKTKGSSGDVYGIDDTVEIPERIDSKTLERVKGFFGDNSISVGIKKANLDNQIKSTKNKIEKIDAKLMKLDSKADEVRTSGMESFVSNTNVKNYDPLLRIDNDVSWMKDEGSGLGKGFDPDDVDPKGSASMVNPKPKPDTEKKKQKGMDAFGSLKKILDRNAVSTAYGQTPLPFMPITAMRYPATTPQDIQDNVELQQAPNTEYVPLQPQLDVKPDTRILDPFTPKPQAGFDTNITPVTAQSADLGNVLSNANALKLGIYPKYINQGLLPKVVQQPPITTTDITQGFRQIQPLPALTKPLSMTGVATAPIAPIKPLVPVPLPIFNPYIPPTKKPRKKKPKTKKKKYRKIYWDVSSSPFKPFNPKEYYTFKNEPRSVKSKEKRKSLD